MIGCIPVIEPNASNPSKLTNTLWLWDQTLMNNDEALAPSDAGNYSIQFMDDGKVVVQADCNTALGNYTVDDTSISIQFGPMTMAACPPESYGDQFVANLSAASLYFFEDGRLFIDLMADSGTMHFTPQSLDLADTSWVVTGYNNGEQAVVSVIAETELTARFDSSGTLSGSAGCNNYNAAYQTKDNNITLGPAATTRKACPEPEDLMTQETQYLTALETASTYTRRGNRLELRTSEGALAVVLQSIK